MFPQKFWFGSALTLVGLSFIGGAALALTGELLHKRLAWTNARVPLTQL